MKEAIFTLDLTDRQCAEIQKYLDFSLRFGYVRNTAIAGHRNRQKWRLNNWKSMTKLYIERGYSYPTISRIKKEIKKKSQKLGNM